MKLPVKITPEPIIESVLEFRFLANLPPESIVGMLYTDLKETYDIVKIDTPTLIASGSSPELIPKYLLNGKKYIFQVGEQMCSISKKMPYEGWKVFLADILILFNYLIKLKIITKLHQISLRYINTFDDNIFDNINIEFKINGEKLKPNQTYFRTAFDEGDYITILQIGMDVAFMRGKELIKKNSLLDIDISTKTFKDNYQDEI